MDSPENTAGGDRMRYLLGDINADHLEMEMVDVDRNTEKSNAVIDVFVKSGSYSGDSRFIVDYSDFVLFHFHMGLLADGEDYIVPELEDRHYGSMIDVVDSVGGLIYDDRSDGYQSLEFDFLIEPSQIADFVSELRQGLFTRRSVGGMDLDVFLTALIRLYAEASFEVRGVQGLQNGRIGHLGPKGRSRTKPVRKGPLYYVEKGAEGDEILYFDTVGDLINAPMFDGESLLQVWNKMEIISIDGREPQERILEGFTDLAKD